MRKLLIFLSYVFVFGSLHAQHEPLGITADFSVIQFGTSNVQSQGFNTNNVGVYYNPRFLDRKLEIGVNTIVVKDHSEGKFENHYGLRANYLFRNKTNLVPYLGAGLFYTINSDGVDTENAERGSSFKGFAGVRYHFKDWFFLKGEMGNYRYDFEVKGFVIHPTLGLGFSL